MKYLLFKYIAWAILGFMIPGHDSDTFFGIVIPVFFIDRFSQSFGETKYDKK
jgi:hypothetical protein